MRALLIGRNQALVRTVLALADLIRSAAAPAELEPYRTYVLGICAHLIAVLTRNLDDLDRGPEPILEDILSNTQLAMRLAQLLSARIASPILRASPADRLCLRTIAWLHQQHAATASVPAAFGDGHTAVWPFIQVVPIYFMPTAEQRSLLFQPLVFHEFGHLLYAYHQREMDALVADIQRGIEHSLTSSSQRNDRYDEDQISRRQGIVDTWYAWAQELFCDAVGLVIGGPAFLYAFSDHLSRMERGDFYRQPTDLYHSSHPVTRLRISFLTSRARQRGFGSDADLLEDEWTAIGRAMSVTEDHHGFYDARSEVLITARIDDMLAEASPRECMSTEVGSSEDGADEKSPVLLLNQAWRHYRTSPADYPAWETTTVREFLGESRR
jgi:hypothetical protein